MKTMSKKYIPVNSSAMSYFKEKRYTNMDYYCNVCQNNQPRMSSLINHLKTWWWGGYSLPSIPQCIIIYQSIIIATDTNNMNLLFDE